MIELDSLIYKGGDSSAPYTVENVKSSVYYYIKKYKYLENVFKIPKRINKAKKHQEKTSQVFREKYLKEIPSDEELLILKNKLKKNI